MVLKTPLALLMSDPVVGDPPRKKEQTDFPTRHGGYKQRQLKKKPSVPTNRLRKKTQNRC